MYKRGDCLLIESNIDKDGYVLSHLFVIIIEVKKKVDFTIIVNSQTIRGGKYDRTTILRTGVHEFITRDSFINYRLARVISYEELDELVRSRKAKKKPPLKDETLAKVVEGILNSRFTPMQVKEMYRDYLMDNLEKVE